MGPRPRRAPSSRSGQIVVLATIAYSGLWALYLLVPDFKVGLLATPYLGRAIELFTGLSVAVVMIWGAHHLICRG